VEVPERRHADKRKERQHYDNNQLSDGCSERPHQLRRAPPGPWGGGLGGRRGTDPRFDPRPVPQGAKLDFMAHTGATLRAPTAPGSGGSAACE
jgi:hypothetical protein